MRRVAPAFAAITMLAATARPQSGPATTRPTTTSQPATTQAATTRASADVSAAAAPVLDRLAAAYANAVPMDFVASVVGTFDVAGRSKMYTLEISGRTDGDGRFFHYGSGVGLLVSDGTNAYLYDQRRNAYAELQATPRRPAPAELDEAISDVLIDENPALLLTLTTDPAGLLKHLAKAVRLPAGKADGRADGLVLELPMKLITLEVDPKTGLITRSTIDYAPAMTARHAAGVRRADAVLTYTRQAHAATTMPADAFAWQPPATASQIVLHAELLRSMSPRGGSDKSPRP